METIKRREIPIEFQHVSKLRNKQSGMAFYVDTDTTLRDFYYYNKTKTEDFPESVTKNVNEKLTLLTQEESAAYESNFYYELHFSNKGGCVMPVIIQWNYTDGTSETEHISAYIWRKNEQKFTKTFAKTKQVQSIVIDPYKETADIDEKNNTWPNQIVESRFDIFKTKRVGRFDNSDLNLMQKAKEKK
jgi:hypothetical protein